MSAWPRVLVFFSIMLSVLSRIAQRGPVWAIRRSVDELLTPTTAPGRTANRVLRSLANLARIGRPDSSRARPDHLLAIYDLQTEPNTFDIIHFLMAAERRRRHLRLSALHVLIAMSTRATKKAEPQAYLQAVNESSLRDRVTNIHIPLAWSMPSVRSVGCIEDRNDLRQVVRAFPISQIFPPDYTVDLHPVFNEICLPQLLRGITPADVKDVFRASDSARDYISRWLKNHGQDRPAVSMTLRTYGYNTERNSNLDAWSALARYLDDKGYCVVIVPDTESLAEALPSALSGFAKCPEAAININLRLALYERSFLNLGINNGPSYLFLLGEHCRGLMFKIVTPGVPQAEERFIEKRGYKIGEQLPFFTPYQKMIWEDDRLDVLVREFDAMERLILNAEPHRRLPS